ncbi:MAG: hypothetical protein JSW41_04610 [Candidatus Aenigmatarchaeota archaeon]|nr:MAG: hypothetical protein JSW41_04610 [Candidatus Aenigmarchaeota archaeon]
MKLENKFEDFVNNFLVAMEGEDLASAIKLTDALAEEDKLPALDALLKGIEAKDDEYKEKHKEFIDALVTTKAKLVVTSAVSSDEPDTGDSVAPSEEAAPVEEAPADNKEEEKQ